MMRRLRASSPLLLVPVLAGLLVVACDDDVETNPTTSTSGTGGTSTSSSGTGGDGGSGATTSSSTSSGTGGTGGDGGTGGSGGTVIPNTGDDDCTGDSYNIPAGTHIQLEGHTSTATHLHTGLTCTGGPTASDGPDRVYEFVIQDPGSIKILVEQDGGTLNPTIYFRSVCADDQAPLGCYAKFPDKEGFAGDIPEATTVYMFVDGADASSGPYIISIDHEAPACGDGVVNPDGADGIPNTLDDEECDDGNTVALDGCSGSCKFNVVSLFDTCDGEPVVLQVNVPQVLTGNTTGYADDYTASATAGCSFAPASGGKDRVYEIVPAQNGTLTATIGYDVDCTTGICDTYTGIHPGCWDYVLYAQGPDVCSGGTQLSCSDSSSSTTPEVVSFPVQTGLSYFLFVDGYGQWPGSYGPYNLCLSLAP